MFSNARRVLSQRNTRLRLLYLLNIYFTISSLVLVSLEKIHQPLSSVFHFISKHLKVGQKYSAVRRIFNSEFAVFGKCCQTLSFMFALLVKVPIETVNFYYN